MRTKEELISLISECEAKIKKMKADLDGFYDAFDPQVDPLVEKSNELEKQKGEIKKQSAPAFLWAIAAVLLVGAIVCNAIKIPALTGVLFIAALAVGGYTFSIKSKYDKEYNAQIAKIDSEQDALEAQIDEIYSTDPRIEATEKKIEQAENDLKALNAEFADIKIVEDIGTNNLIVYCSFVGLPANECYANLDGSEFIVKDSVALYYLNPGEHTFFMNVFRPESRIDMPDINFSVNDTNKYVYIKHDMRTYEYETKVYDSFDDFGANFKDTKWVKEKLLECKKNMA